MIKLKYHNFSFNIITNNLMLYTVDDIAKKRAKILSKLLYTREKKDANNNIYNYC